MFRFKDYMDIEDLKSFCPDKNGVSEGPPFAGLHTEEQFNQSALQCFRFQAEHNPVYSLYLESLAFDTQSVEVFTDIPFLPIEFFKTHRVYAGDESEEIRFLSSGTTGMQPSIHYIASLAWYIKSFSRGFNIFYGPPEDYCFLALLPSYLERKHSSLVYMLDHLIKKSRFSESGFYLSDLEGLREKLEDLEASGTKTILLGVSYALLDLAANYPVHLKNTIVIETGGMKGRREELSRHELHRRLSEGFILENIHSEYGMTELLSQAYSSEKGLFKTPPWMKIRIRDPYDPFSYLEDGRSGGINIIDLANWYSCSFIETQDLGRLHPDQSFEILGRFDNSDIRGCNLLVQ